ncbi:MULTISPECIES: hypothetical protein [Actinomadura]|uniref:hypothetical protein n=1 Tax=Actinomadura TaxID=1988 RepID=UPI0014868317|nr:hypothetical protein [Actinomadura geliboluensis]
MRAPTGPRGGTASARGGGPAARHRRGLPDAPRGAHPSPAWEARRDGPAGAA